MVEIILKKVSPALYQALGVFLPLITTNCCILGVTILVIQKDFDLLTGVVYAFSTALGFALALIVFAGIREQLALVNIPKGMRGMSIALVTAGLLAMAFMGFSGVDKGLSTLFGLDCLADRLHLFCIRRERVDKRVRGHSLHACPLVPFQSVPFVILLLGRLMS